MDKSVQLNAHVVSMKMMMVTPAHFVTTTVNVVDLYLLNVVNVGPEPIGMNQNVLQFAQMDIMLILPPILVTFVMEHARHVSEH